MKKRLLLTITALAMVMPIWAIAESTGQKYTCVMHPEVVMDAPGECPKCGMTLVPVKTEKKRSREAGPNAERPMPKSEKQTVSPSHDMQSREMAMSSSLNLADPMSRESSGSSWVPDSTPMYGRMLMFGDDMLMLHGAIFPRYVNANTDRGDDRIDGPNWFMAMYSHRLGENAQLGFRGMMSLDLLTEGGRGYPLLFQTGETWNGNALHDRQHPHDLFDE
ncbi:MAG TPA: heavy metal-binding domain-containing protein, partial [Chthoniobacterales bacterium]|nr:heavy metal-binding domain-containing protein [Chthoniobacterales bacterium]